MASNFTEKAAESLSRSLAEPDWLTGFRLEAWRQFAALPAEKNPLYTKYASLSAFDGAPYRASTEKTDVDLRTFFTGFLSGAERNILLQGNDHEVHADLDPSLATRGVRLLPIEEAVKADEPLLRRLFAERLLQSESDKYAAFTNAFFNSGTFVHVPKGVSLEQPLRKMLVTDRPPGAVVEQTFIYAEELSKLVFLEELYSRPGQSASLLASSLEIRAAPGASVDYSSIQALDDQAVFLTNRAIDLSADSRVTVSSLSLGSSVSRSRMNFVLNGRGSVAEGYEIFFTEAKQRYDFESNLVHNAPDSTGSTQARGVLKGESQSIFKGMIKIGAKAKGTRAYLAHHAMLLDRTAKSDAVPGLEIDTNEVKATHSASVAQVDEEQVFYLMARGLSADEAKKMLVLGFFEPVLSRVPVEETREGARFLIEGRWHGETRRLLDREALVALTGEAPTRAAPAEDIFQRHYKYRQ